MLPRQKVIAAWHCRRLGKATKSFDGNLSWRLIALRRVANAMKAPAKTITQTKANAWRIARNAPSPRRPIMGPKPDGGDQQTVAGASIVGPPSRKRQRASLS